MKKLILSTFVIAALFAAQSAWSSLITDDSIEAIPSVVVGSGNGTLDIVMFAQEKNTNKYKSSSYDFDDGNTLDTQGDSKSDLGYWAESYYTSVQDLLDFYALNFGDTDQELMFLLDLNEKGESENYFTTIDIILNPTVTLTSSTLDPYSNDIQSDEQDAINQQYTSGTLLASLPSSSSENLPVIQDGDADYYILTGINLLDLEVDDTLLINISMSNLSGQEEKIFISGTYSAADMPSSAAPVPEPATMLLLAAGLAGLAGMHRKRKEQ